MSDNQPIPTQIQLHKQSRLLELQFSDGTRFELPCKYLRVFSTSAEVQVAKERGQYIKCKDDVNISAIEPVGNYAVNIQFDDGHNTGIFSWETLYDLGQNFADNWADYQAGNAPR